MALLRVVTRTCRRETVRSWKSSRFRPFPISLTESRFCRRRPGLCSRHCNGIVESCLVRTRSTRGDKYGDFPSCVSLSLGRWSAVPRIYANAITTTSKPDMDW